MKPARRHEPDFDEFEELDFEIIAVEEVPDPDGVRWRKLFDLLEKEKASQEDKQ